jgi:hypothetical protein
MALTASFDPFPGLNVAGSGAATGAQYKPTAATLDYSLTAAGEPETPSDILHYYQSGGAATSGGPGTQRCARRIEGVESPRHPRS